MAAKRVSKELGLDIQKNDIGSMPLIYKAVIIASEFLRFASKRFPFICSLADSVYLRSKKGVDLFK